MKEIKLYPLKNERIALVSDEDFESLNKYHWTLGNIGYPYREEWNKMSRKKISMHREIMSAQKGQTVDHINGDKLDNTRENLRICTQSLNCKNQVMKSNNSSGYKGVSWDKRACRWSVFITHNYKHIFGGYFEDKLEAARKYNELATQYHGDFARLNVC